jgi:hypothetical protein
MQDIQEIYDRVQETKIKQRELRVQYKDALASAPEYQSVKDKLAGYRLRKKQLEAEVRADMAGTLNELERLNKSLADDQQMLSDIAMSKLMKGETVEVTGKDDAAYEPVFTVRFKRRDGSTAFVRR